MSGDELVRVALLSSDSEPGPPPARGKGTAAFAVAASFAVVVVVLCVVVAAGSGSWSEEPFAAVPSFADTLLDPTLEELLKQDDALSLFDTQRCFAEHHGDWDDQALRRVYQQYLVPASRAMNLDVYSEDVLAFQRPYACVQEAERRNRLWRAQRGDAPSRVLVVVAQRKVHRVPPEELHPFLNERVPGALSCDFFRSEWRAFLNNEEERPRTNLLWLLGYALGWDCDLLMDPANSTSAWTREYDVVLVVTAFEGEPWYASDENEGWRNPWIDRFVGELEHHSPLLLNVPHEPHVDCSEEHYPAQPPFCPVTVDNYACFDQPGQYLQLYGTDTDKQQSRPPRSLSTLLHYHYDVKTLHSTFASSSPSREVLWSAGTTGTQEVELANWLKQQGFMVHSRKPQLHSPDDPDVHDMSKFEVMQQFGRQKYGIVTTLRQSAGQVAVELAILGVPVFITVPKLFHRLVHHPWLLVRSLDDVQRKIEYLESHPHAYEQLRAYALARVRFVDLSSLPDAAQIAMRVQATLSAAESSHKKDVHGQELVDSTAWHLCSRRG